MTSATLPTRPKITKKKAKVGSAWVLAEFGFEQALRLVRSAILTRLITQQMLGLLAMSSVVVDLVASSSDFGVTQSIIRRKHAHDRKFLDTAWTLSIVRGFWVWVIVCALAYPAAWFFNTPSLALAAPLLGFGAVITGAWSTKVATTNRDLRVGWTTTMRMGAAIFGLVATVAWAYVAPDHLGVIIVGPIVTAIMVLIGSFLWLRGPNDWFAWDRESLRELIRFGRWIFIGTLMTYVLKKGDLFVVGKMEGAETLAVYSLAYQIGNLAPRISQALNSRIVVPIYSAVQDDDLPVLRRKLYKMRSRLMLLLLPGLWVLTIGGRHIIHLIYPPAYHDAGWMLELIAAVTTGRVVTMSIGGILLARGDSFMFTAAKVGGGLMTIGTMVAGHWLGQRFGGPQDGLTGLIIGMGVGYWANYLATVAAIRRHGTWMPGLDFACFAMSMIALGIRQLIY